MSTIKARGTVEICTGPRAWSRWSFGSTPAGHTLAEFACECELPASLAGLAAQAGRVIVRDALRQDIEEGLARLAAVFDPSPTLKLAR